MNYLYLLNEMYNNGYSIKAIDIISIIAILCGILVITTKNPIISVLFLIGLFLSISIYLVLIGLNFVGLSYLLVYVGAVSILFLFILMLINVKVSELLSNTSNSLILAIIIAISFLYPLYNILPYSIKFSEESNLNIFNFLSKKTFGYNIQLEEKLSYVTSKIWDGYLWETSHITSIGNILYTNYNMWLIITSMILLLAMIGAILITIKQKNV